MTGVCEKGYGVLRECRLIIEPVPQQGDWNMAVDEALLDSVISGSPAVLRWYRWREPTLSLGYFQNINGENPRWADLPKVRRLTGGGAILHDREWTYSCVLPAEQTLIRHPYDLYDTIHRAVMEWFQQTWGITLEQRGVSTRDAVEPTLCFLRQDSHDVVYGDTKVLGSAQRRRKGVLLQHGSLIMESSQLAPELPGLVDLLTEPSHNHAAIQLRSALRNLTQFAERSVSRLETAPPTPDDLRSQLAMFVAQKLSASLVPSQLSDAEYHRAEMLRDAYRATTNRPA